MRIKLTECKIGAKVGHSNISGQQKIIRYFPVIISSTGTGLSFDLVTKIAGKPHVVALVSRGKGFDISSNALPLALTEPHTHGLVHDPDQLMV